MHRSHPPSHYPPLGREFNQPVDFLPETITHLTFGDAFRQPVFNLPPRITHLSFGKSFWNSSLHHLPPSITHLKFGQQSKNKWRGDDDDGDHGKLFLLSLDRLPPFISHLALPFGSVIRNFDHHFTFEPLRKLENLVLTSCHEDYNCVYDVSIDFVGKQVEISFPSLLSLSTASDPLYRPPFSFDISDISQPSLDDFTNFWARTSQ